jgi:hypothetical protein
MDGRACCHKRRPLFQTRTIIGTALQELDAAYPDVGGHARHELDKWFVERAHVEHMLEGLRKAGLTLAEDGSAAEA